MLKSVQKGLIKAPLETYRYLELAEEYLKIRNTYSEIKCCKLAIKSSPDDKESKLLLGQALMRNGNYEGGLHFFEERIYVMPNNGKYPINIARINSYEEIFDDSLEILVLAEMGRGDMIQFSRYAKIIKTKCKRLVGIVPSDLIDLFKRSELFDVVVNEYQPSQLNKTRWIPFLSMAKILKASRKNPLINDPYLIAEVKSTKEWKSKLHKSRKDLLICLNWSAQRWEKEQSQQDSRHIDIEELLPLTKLNKVMFCSVQKGKSKENWRTCSFKDRFTEIQPLIDNLNSFDDTAAILQASDICITVDTSVAHLAGALGVKTWILLKYSPCWRWGTGKNGVRDSYWYKKTRIVCQESNNSWEDAVNNITEELLSLEYEQND